MSARAVVAGGRVEKPKKQSLLRRGTYWQMRAALNMEYAPSRAITARVYEAALARYAVAAGQLAPNVRVSERVVRRALAPHFTIVGDTYVTEAKKAATTADSDNA